MIAQINNCMKYTITNPWKAESKDTERLWSQWLAINALSGSEYQLLHHDDRIELEFFDQDRAAEFAQEHGL